MKTVALALLGLAALAGFAACEPGAGMSPLEPIQDMAPQGCAEGSRQGLFDRGKFPAIAACAGAWSGSVDHARGLCSSGWHVCTGGEASVRSIRFDDAHAFQGCFAFDAAQDNWACHPGCLASVAAGLDSAENIDMAGLGAGCPWSMSGQSCISGGRIDASENSGTGCNFRPGLTGVVCCTGERAPSEPTHPSETSDASAQPPAPAPAPTYTL